MQLLKTEKLEDSLTANLRFRKRAEKRIFFV